MEMCYDGALVMPSSYAVMSEEEMMYLEGGKFISKSKCIEGLAVIGMSPNTYIAAALTYTLAKCLIRKVCTALGVVAGAVVGCILGWAAGQVILFGKSLARGALNKGVDITWNMNPFKACIGVNASVRY